MNFQNQAYTNTYRYTTAVMIELWKFNKYQVPMTKTLPLSVTKFTKTIFSYNLLNLYLAAFYTGTVVEET